MMLILEIFASTLPHTRTEVAEVKTRYKSIFSKKQRSHFEGVIYSLFMKRQPLYVLIIMIVIPSSVADNYITTLTLQFMVCKAIHTGLIHVKMFLHLSSVK